MAWAQRNRAREVLQVTYFLHAPQAAVSAWASDRGLPGWIEGLPGGWTLLRTAAVDGQLVGSAWSAEAVLLDSEAVASRAFLADGETTRGVREGRPFGLDDAEMLPWEADDPRPSRGLAAVRGDVSADLSLLAAALGDPVVAAIRAGWTLILDDTPQAALAVLDSGEYGPTLGLVVRGDVLRLSLLDDGDVRAEWEFGAPGALVASDRLPTGEIGALALELISPTDAGVTPFLELGWPLVHADDLARALANKGPAASVLPPLLRALGLPDAVRAHLIGERDLATERDTITVTSEGSWAASTRRAMRSDWLTAAARSPRRRMWRAIGGGVYLVGVAALAAVLFPKLSVEWMDSLWFILGFFTLGIGASVAASAIRKWWVLREPNRLGADGRPRTSTPGWGARLRRWINGRGPSSVIAALMALGFAAGGLMQWQSDAVLRDGGIEVTARVVVVGEASTSVEWPMLNGQTGTTDITYRSPDLRPGDTVAVVYDPLDPDHAKAVDDLNDVSIYILFGGVAVFCLLTSVLTWFRVVDWQRIDNWLR